MIPSVEEFPYAIRVVSEVLSSNGSTSQGSICGSTLALMDAGCPLSGLWLASPAASSPTRRLGEWRTFTDIQGVEDFHGEMDFKVAGTTEGITAIQMDLKNKGFTYGDHCRRFGATRRLGWKLSEIIADALRPR